MQRIKLQSFSRLLSCLSYSQVTAKKQQSFSFCFMIFLFIIFSKGSSSLTWQFLFEQHKMKIKWKTTSKIFSICAFKYNKKNDWQTKKENGKCCGKRKLKNKFSYFLLCNYVVCLLLLLLLFFCGGMCERMWTLTGY